MPNVFLQPSRLTVIGPVSYLVLETSYYTKGQFKAFKSLQAYNQLVSGFVQSVHGLIIAGKHVVLAKVRHSQKMNDPTVLLWIITEDDGKILCAHCRGCKAGQGGTCSHIASVLFYIETFNRIRGKLAELNFIRTPSPEQAKIVEEDTRKQSGCNAFFQHRVGRIGAAINKQACQTNPAQPSHSLIKTICYPHFFRFSNAATEHGCKHEKQALAAYELAM